MHKQIIQIKKCLKLTLHHLPLNVSAVCRHDSIFVKLLLHRCGCTLHAPFRLSRCRTENMMCNKL